MIHIFDGALGTMLQASGLEVGMAPELMNLEKPSIVEEIHYKYLLAGADMIETNTFGASPLKLTHYALAKRYKEINRAAVQCARRAIARANLNSVAKVVGAMGPTGRFIAPLGDLDFEEAFSNYKEQAQVLIEAGVDVLLIETCIDIQEMRAALLAVRDISDIPLICQLSYSQDGRTVTGTDPESAAVLLEAMGANVIGANCSLGPQELVPIVKKLAESCRVPISAQPNAGMPQLKNGLTEFTMTAQDFAKWGVELVRAGATYLGGCCGTTPQHIRALAGAAKKIAPSPREQKARLLRLTSRSRTVSIGADLPTVLIGERINPTGRKKMAAELLDGSFMMVKKEALGQVKAGAQVLDVNVGVGGLDEASTMRMAVTEIAQLVDAPPAIDTGSPTALEAGLRAYPGRALINSVSAESERLDKFLPLAKKYGAAILCLPLTDAGLPQSVDERVTNAKLITERAKAIGLRDEDFLLDALVLTVSASKEAALSVLATLSRYNSELALPTTMGLSNISFGLPNRTYINAAFCAMALSHGLNAPIMNPYDANMQSAVKTGAVLLGKDPCGIAYAKEASAGSAALNSAAPPPSENPLLALKNAVIEGNKELAPYLVDEALYAGYDSAAVTNQALTGAMEDIGEDFGAGRMFLPQVLLAAETMRMAFTRLSERMPSAVAATKGTVILATVKGDIHDLGKNIVGALLTNYGFNVIDLGKDIAADTIVEAAQKYRADIVGLCALMTTTMVQIDIVIDALHKAGSSAKVMVGGAAVTGEYAQSAGADAYASDGVRAVKLAEELLK